MKRLLTVVIAAEERMSNFVVGLTNDNPETTAPVYKQYHHVQYDGTVPPSRTAAVIFPPSNDTFRYVIIQQQFNAPGDAIRIVEVRVFLRGKWTSCVIPTIITLMTVAVMQIGAGVLAVG